MKCVEYIPAHTFHGRKGKVMNAFRYSVDFVLIDPESDLQAPMLFSRNRANLMAFRDSDHGGEPRRGTGAAWLRRQLAEHQLPQPARIALLTQPRVLGHVFNPVSFWFCHDESDAIVMVLAEVTNTFGTRHSYLCHKPDLSPITRRDRLSATKMLHVSPFQPCDGGYSFRFDVSADRIGVRIDYGHSRGGLVATLTGPRRVLTNYAILWSVLRRPFGARRVYTLIHWQALKLWWKGARFRPAPPAHKSHVSRG